jgi:hypothetical protein
VEKSEAFVLTLRELTAAPGSPSPRPAFFNADVAISLPV